MCEQITGARDPERRLDGGDAGSGTGQSCVRRLNPVRIGGGVRLEGMVGGWRHPDPVETEAFTRRLHHVLVSVMGRIERSSYEADRQTPAGAREADRLS
jgi:hypothetical protein